MSAVTKAIHRSHTVRPSDWHLELETMSDIRTPATKMILVYLPGRERRKSALSSAGVLTAIINQERELVIRASTFLPIRGA